MVIVLYMDVCCHKNEYKIVMLLDAFSLFSILFSLLVFCVFWESCVSKYYIITSVTSLLGLAVWKNIPVWWTRCKFYTFKSEWSRWVLWPFCLLRHL